MKTTLAITNRRFDPGRVLRAARMECAPYLVAAALALLGPAARAATNDLTSAIQRGLFEEEANRDLVAAIKAYQAVASQFDKDRKLAATAIFRLGECYRKQGNTNEAAAQYERVLREFTDQPTLVTLSRQNLATLGSAPTAAAAAPVLSEAARQEQKRLLEEELKLVEKQLGIERAKAERGLVGSDSVLGTEREVLKLKRQLAALEAGQPISFAAREAAAPATSSEGDEVKHIQALIKESPDLINAPDRKGETLLQSAAAKGKLSVVKLLLDNGAAVDGLQQPGLTALHYAAGNGHKAVVDLLLSKGANAGAETVGGVTALHLAARKGYEEVAKALLGAGAPVNAATKAASAQEYPGGGLQYVLSTSGQTPLHLASSAGYAGLVELLLAKGADPNVVDGSGRTALSYAVDKHYLPVAQLLLAAHANPNAGTSHLPLTLAAFHGDTPTLKLLLANGAEPNLKANLSADYYNRVYGLNSRGGKATALTAAVSQKHPEAVTELIRAKADPNGSTDSGTPLIFCVLGDAPTLKALLEGGADPNRPDRQGISPLLNAVGTEGGQAGVELLLAHKADVNGGRAAKGWTPLHDAARRGRKLIAELLLKAGAEVNARDENGWTPLYAAVWNNQPEVAEVLLANKADPNAKAKEGQTPLHIAVKEDRRELAELLLANGADPNLRDIEGRTPLDWAKSMAQQGRPMPLGTTPSYPGQTMSSPAIRQEQESKSQTLADLLRRHGALDDLPHLDQIGARRSAIGASGAKFTKGAQDWNQFTLLELLAVQYNFLAASPSSTGGDAYSAASFARSFGGLPFPDLVHLHISRPSSDLKGWQDQVVDLRPVLESGDCAKDVRLRWGDVVEIPEADHPLNESWTGFSRVELANFKKCLSRQVEIVVKGQSTKFTLAPKISNLEEQVVPSPNAGLRIQEPTIVAGTPFWLKPVLLQSKLVLISSDLSRVKVTRREAGTGQKREWVVDCSKRDSAPDFWLRDGDRIEVPEKSLGSAATQAEAASAPSWEKATQSSRQIPRSALRAPSPPGTSSR